MDGASVLRPAFSQQELNEFAQLGLLGRSSVFLHVLQQIKRLVACDATALIQGETGTGKEVVARAVHALSKRRNHPFIAINCGALPDNLVESELFGHEKGAFTDAKASHPGVIAQAKGGTLLLDEIEAMSSRGQVALLRFLETRKYRAVGSSRERHVDVRIIAASNQDLRKMVEEKLFREDLLFRLNLLCINLPPLRHRGSDILLLAEAFVARFSQQYGKARKKLHPDTVAAFQHYQWPGNVRELENAIHREFLMSDEPMIRFVPGITLERRKHSRHCITVPQSGNYKIAKARAIAQFEKSYLTSLLAEAGGNLSFAARLAGKERSALGKLLKKHGLQRIQFKRVPEQ